MLLTSVLMHRRVLWLHLRPVVAVAELAAARLAVLPPAVVAEPVVLAAVAEAAEVAAHLAVLPVARLRLNSNT